jgi:hypothetical protein
MEVRCPHCHETLSSDAMGQVVGCPHCQNPFMMPEDDLPVAGPLSVQAPTEAAVVPEQQPQQPQQTAPNPAENIVITTHPRVEPRYVAIYTGMRNTLLFIVGLLSVLVVLSYAYPDLLRFQKQHRSPKEAVREGLHSTDSPKQEKIPVQPPKPGRSPEELVRVALESTDPVQQEKAAVELAELGRPALKHLQRLLAESQSNQVRAAVIQGVAFQRDYDSMPILLDAMADPSLVVRGRAGAAVQRLLGLEFSFDADGPPDEREKIITAVRRQWESLRDSPGFKTRKKEMQSQL